MNIIVAADHRGFELKEALKAYLSQVHEVHDVGANAYDASDDYPDFGHAAAQIVATSPGSKGILFCGSGMGMDVVANKVKGIRASVVASKETAVHAASHDGINIITIPADTISLDQAKDIVDAFLATPLKQEEKYLRRLQKISMIEDMWHT
jgi:ribose 5-phosphate isomerase B